VRRRQGRLRGPRREAGGGLSAPLQHVRSYYAALADGDEARIAAHFHPEAVHYYTRLGPHRGAEEIARYAGLAVRELHAEWKLEHGIGDDREAVIEWSMRWRDPRTGEPRLDRGTEWFAFRDRLISEVRAYHHSGPGNRSGDLVGFDHAARGHAAL
jgi:ketosteroid isomerase-like protein